jgi:hypothetical protein
VSRCLSTSGLVWPGATGPRSLMMLLRKKVCVD